MILSLLLLMGMQAPQYQVNWMSRLTGAHGHGEICMSKQEAQEWANKGDEFGSGAIAYWISRCDLVVVTGTDHQGDLFQRAAPNGCIDPCYEAPNSYPPQAPHTLPFFTEIPHATWDAPEPLDVPAIQVFTEEEVAIRIRNFGPEYWRNPWTCKDETRILEHDEQSVPLYWCRKVLMRSGKDGSFRKMATDKSVVPATPFILCI